MDQVLNECLYNVSNTLFDRNLLVFMSAFHRINFIHSDVHTYLILTEEAQEMPQSFGNFNNYIVIITNFKEFEYFLQLLKMARLLNSRAPFLLFYLGSAEFDDIFKLSWKYYIFNLNLAVYENGEFNIYTYFPYENGKCREYTKYKFIQKCSDGLGNFFPNKIPNVMNGCLIRVMPYAMIPYVLDINGPKERPELVGLEVTITHSMTKWVNMTTIFMPNNYTIWGYLALNGSYVAIFKELYEGKTDMIIGMSFGNASSLIDFDGGFVHLMEFTSWYVPTAEIIPHWLNIVRTFPWLIWFLILLSFLIYGVVWWLFHHYYNEDTNQRQFSNAMLYSLYSLLQGSVNQPTILNLRLLFLCWIFGSLLISVAYQCELVSVLTVALYGHQISTFKELLESDLPMGMFETALLGYLDDPFIHTIKKKFVSCPLTTACLNHTAYEKNFAVMRNKRSMNYYIPRFYLDSSGKIMLYRLPDVHLSLGLRFHYYKGFPLLERFDKVLSGMRENGLVSKWDNDMGKSYQIHGQSNLDHEPLTSEHLQGAFCILMLGLFLASLLFVGEICHKYFKEHTGKT